MALWIFCSESLEVLRQFVLKTDDVLFYLVSNLIVVDSGDVKIVVCAKPKHKCLGSPLMEWGQCVNQLGLERLGEEDNCVVCDMCSVFSACTG